MFQVHVVNLLGAVAWCKVAVACTRGGGTGWLTVCSQLAMVA